MSAGSGLRPPPLPRPPSSGRQALLFTLTALALAMAITIAALAYFLRPASALVHETPAFPPAFTDPNAPVLATDLFIGADDFVVEVFHNGHRVPDEARSMTAEVYGAIGERTRVTVRAGDWLVFNVANNRLRWGGVYYFGVAGVDENGAMTFVSEISPQWSVCEDPGQVPRFIAESEFLADRAVQPVEKPWARGNQLIASKVQGWNGQPIWGSPTNRNLWIKYRAPGGN